MFDVLWERGTNVHHAIPTPHHLRRRLSRSHDKVAVIYLHAKKNKGNELQHCRRSANPAQHPARASVMPGCTHDARGCLRRATAWLWGMYRAARSVCCHHQQRHCSVVVSLQYTQILPSRPYHRTVVTCNTQCFRSLQPRWPSHTRQPPPGKYLHTTCMVVIVRMNCSMW